MFSVLIYFKIQFIPVMAKLNFKQLLLQSSVSHDPLEIIFICGLAAQETFIIINVENSCGNIFVESDVFLCIL